MAVKFDAVRVGVPELILVRPRRFVDSRGVMMETYRHAEFVALGIDSVFLQDNEAHSPCEGTLRGLHFQAPPFAQAKLVRVLKGAIFDVAVDLRRGSPSFGTAVGASLTADGGEQLFVPRGFAHGYATLEDDSVVSYKCDSYYAPEAEGGIQFNDPALGIKWPKPPQMALMSDKDRALPRLAGFASPFIF